jgi:hypothetical protein
MFRDVPTDDIQRCYQTQTQLEHLSSGTCIQPRTQAHTSECFIYQLPDHPDFSDPLPLFMTRQSPRKNTTPHNIAVSRQPRRCTVCEGRPPKATCACTLNPDGSQRVKQVSIKYLFFSQVFSKISTLTYLQRVRKPPVPTPLNAPPVKPQARTALAAQDSGSQIMATPTASPPPCYRLTMNWMHTHIILSACTTSNMVD